MKHFSGDRYINSLFQGRDGKLIPSNNKFLIIILALEKYFIWPHLDKYGRYSKIHPSPEIDC